MGMLGNLEISGGATAGTLDDLTDVAITSPQDGDVLVFDAASGHWVNILPSAVGLVQAQILKLVSLRG